MDENKKIRLFSYNKVWKFEKKIYAIMNLVLPVPISTNDALYFGFSFAVMYIMGRMLPLVESIPAAIRCLIIPYGMMKFLTKKKLDGKNPIKYFCGYLYYIFYERHTYLEKFKTNSIIKEEKLVINWSCSRGYRRHPQYDSFTSALNEIENAESEETKIVSGSAGGTDYIENEEKSNEHPGKKRRIMKLTSGPRLRQNFIAEDEETEPTAIDAGSGFDITGKVGDLYDKAASKFSDLKVKERMIGAARQMTHQLKNVQFNRRNVHQSETSAVKIDVLETQEEAVINTNTDIQIAKKKKVSEKKEKAVKEDIIPILDNITLVIAIGSLSSGTGCTHISKALASYIKESLRMPVCIVDIKNKILSSSLNGVDVYKKENLFDLYDKYKFIILDIGKIDAAVQKEIKQSQIKIMSSMIDDDYMMLMADHVMDMEYAKKWKYIFNHVPKGKEYLVHDNMESFEHWIMPVNDAVNFDKDTKEAFRRILTRGTL